MHQKCTNNAPGSSLRVTHLLRAGHRAAGQLSSKEHSRQLPRQSQEHWGWGLKGKQANGLKHLQGGGIHSARSF